MSQSSKQPQHKPDKALKPRKELVKETYEKAVRLNGGALEKLSKN